MELPERPEEIPHFFVEAWIEHDARRLASVFAEDAEFVNVVGLWWHDRASIERAHAYGFKRIFPDSTLRLVRSTVRMLGEDIAVVHAKMRLTDQSSVSDVAKPGIRQNIFSFVARRTGGGWECVSAHNNDVVPGAETNVIDSDGRMRSVSYR